MVISIIIPVFNSEKYLNKCIKSITSQTYRKLEIILVNDGSTDKSGEICDFWSVQDDRIITVHQNNSGVSTARNKGIDIASGDYITFIDSDDYVANNYIEIMVNELIKCNYDLVMCSFIDRYEYWKNDVEHKLDEKRLHELSGDIRKDYHKLFPLPIYPVLKLYRTSIIKHNKIKFPETFTDAEDQVFNFSYFNHIKTYKYINKPLYYYVHRKCISLSKICTKKSYDSNVNKLILERIFYDNLGIKGKKYLLSDSVLFIVAKYIICSDEDGTYRLYRNKILQLKKYYMIAIMESGVRI